MKKILLATLISAAVFTTANAQTEMASKTLSKADKEAAKAKKEADLTEAFTKAELTAEQQTKCRTVLEASNGQAKSIKADASITEDGKKEKLEAIYKERNDSLKAIMGDAKYQVFKATQKAQKEAAAATKAAQ